MDLATSSQVHSVGPPVILAHDIQYSAHVPTAFIQAHLAQLLPSWTAPVASVLVVLQRPQVALSYDSPEVEADKDRLRSQFIQLGNAIAHQLRNRGHEAEIFDPRTGFPMRSEPGSLPLDDVAVVHSVLGYRVINVGSCREIIHPQWGEAVYPSTVMSSASPSQMAAIAHQILSALC